MIADPKYASKNMRVAASINDALRARLQRQGAALVLIIGGNDFFCFSE